MALNEWKARTLVAYVLVSVGFAFALFVLASSLQGYKQQNESLVQYNLESCNRDNEVRILVQDTRVVLAALTKAALDGNLTDAQRATFNGAYDTLSQGVTLLDCSPENVGGE